MSLIKFRVRVLEPFKDGNVLGGKLLLPEQVHVLDEQDFTKAVNSGGLFEVLEQLVPNPLKGLTSLVKEQNQNDPHPVDPEAVNDAIKEARGEGYGYGVASNPPSQTEPGPELPEVKLAKAKVKKVTEKAKKHAK